MGGRAVPRAVLPFRRALTEISLWKPGCLVTNALPSPVKNGLLWGADFSPGLRNDPAMQPGLAQWTG